MEAGAWAGRRGRGGEAVAGVGGGGGRVGRGSKDDDHSEGEGHDEVCSPFPPYLCHHGASMSPAPSTAQLAVSCCDARWAPSSGPTRPCMSCRLGLRQCNIPKFVARNPNNEHVIFLQVLCNDVPFGFMKSYLEFVVI